MKSLYFASLAALLAIAAATHAEAAPSGKSFEALAVPAAAEVAVPYDHCHGRTSGTSDASCGKTITGGPAGGLF